MKGSKSKKQLNLFSRKDPRKGSFFMTVKDQTEFWSDPFTRSLNSRGKLALAYAYNFVLGGEKIITEDMATDTDIELSEVCDWLELFIAKHRITQDDVLDFVL